MALWERYKRVGWVVRTGRGRKLQLSWLLSDLFANFPIVKVPPGNIYPFAKHLGNISFLTLLTEFLSKANLIFDVKVKIMWCQINICNLNWNEFIEGANVTPTIDMRHVNNTQECSNSSLCGHLFHFCLNIVYYSKVLY